MFLHDLRRFLRFEVLPVLGLKSIHRCEFLLRLEHELRESALGEGLHHAHAETRRAAVIRVQRHESLVRLRRVVVTQLGEVVLAQIGVDAVLKALVPEFGEVLRDHRRPAEVGEA
jgi:hypothetical protein